LAKRKKKDWKLEIMYQDRERHLQAFLCHGNEDIVIFRRQVVKAADLFIDDLFVDEDGFPAVIAQLNMKHKDHKRGIH
jgi:hypothetical protein